MGRILWERGRDWLVETIYGNIYGDNLWKQCMYALPVDEVEEGPSADGVEGKGR